LAASVAAFVLLLLLGGNVRAQDGGSVSVDQTEAISLELSKFSGCIRKAREGVSGEEMVSRVVKAGLAEGFIAEATRMLGDNNPFLVSARNAMLTADGRVLLAMIALWEEALNEKASFERKAQVIFLGAQTLAPILDGSCKPSHQLTTYIEKTRK
jgi:hypothetical protein